MSNPADPSPIAPVYTFRVAASAQAWDALVNESRQGTIFSDSRFLQALDAPHTCYEVLSKSGERMAGIAVIEQADGMHPAPFPFTPHQGILFSQTVCAQAHQKRLTTEFRLTEFLIEQLAQRYGNVSMALSPAFADLRPFAWHNYGASNLPQFAIRPRYTAHLALTDFQFDDYLQSIRAVRRQEFHKSTAHIAQSDDIACFMKLYADTFHRQGLIQSEATLALVERICTSALHHQYGRLSMAVVDGQVASMSLFVFDQRGAYYLFGANDPAWRHTGASTKLMIDNIRHFAERGMRMLDFVGVNSPQRGDFKLSFNPELVPYFEVHLDGSTKRA